MSEARWVSGGVPCIGLFVALEVYRMRADDFFDLMCDRGASSMRFELVRLTGRLVELGVRVHCSPGWHSCLSSGDAGARPDESILQDTLGEVYRATSAMVNHDHGFKHSHWRSHEASLIYLAPLASRAQAAQDQGEQAHLDPLPKPTYKYYDADEVLMTAVYTHKGCANITFFDPSNPGICSTVRATPGTFYVFYDAPSSRGVKALSEAKHIPSSRHDAEREVLVLRIGIKVCEPHQAGTAPAAGVGMGREGGGL